MTDLDKLNAAVQVRATTFMQALVRKLGQTSAGRARHLFLGYRQEFFKCLTEEQKVKFNQLFGWDFNE